MSARELGRAHAWCTLLVLTNACAQLWHEFGLWLPCGVAAVPRCSLAWVASQRVRVLLRRLCVGAPGAERAAPGSPEPLGQRSSLELLLLLIIPPSCIFSNFPPQGFQSNFTICRSGSCFAHFQRREAAAVALGALGPPAPLPGLLCPGAAWGGGLVPGGPGSVERCWGEGDVRPRVCRRMLCLPSLFTGKQRAVKRCYPRIPLSGNKSPAQPAPCSFCVASACRLSQAK